MTERNNQQDWLPDFDIIRSFYDNEVTEAVSKLLHETPFTDLFQTLFGEYLKANEQQISIDDLASALQQSKSIDDLQAVEKHFVSHALKSTLSNVTVKGLSKNERTSSDYLFISNHRDIVLDPLLVNWGVMESGLSSCHCAIGDNLLVTPAGKLIAQLNKCFAVLRSIKSPKAMVAAMRTQSSYIRHLRFNQQTNIWIAQKEGRSKDNSDRTNPALIKMLGLARPKELSLADYIKSLKLAPVSISYEWDPCDIQKANELLAEENGTYQKEGQADLKAVKDGLVGDKGRINLTFDTEFHKRLESDANHIQIAAMIDESIQQNYQLFPVNYAAIELLSVKPEAQSPPSFSPQDIDGAKAILENKLHGTSAALREKVLQSYANPAVAKKSRRD